MYAFACATDIPLLVKSDIWTFS